MKIFYEGENIKAVYADGAEISESDKNLDSLSISKENYEKLEEEILKYNVDMTKRKEMFVYNGMLITKDVPVKTI